MKIYMSVDLEGIYGVDRYDRHDVKKAEYWDWKKKVGELMREEVKAVNRGFRSRGKDTLVVFDSHGHENTLNLSDNLKGMRQVSRAQSPGQNFPAMDTSCDGIILWGYHVKAGSKVGKLQHTTSRRIHHIKINNKEVGEVYLHTLYAVEMGLPLLAVSGDIGLEKEVKEDIGEIPFFNSDSGKNLARQDYLKSIEKFINNLDVGRSRHFFNQTSLPRQTRIEVKYKNASINIARFILRRQYRYATLKGLSACEYWGGNFIEQWDQFCGYDQMGKGQREKGKEQKLNEK